MRGTPSIDIINHLFIIILSKTLNIRQAWEQWPYRLRRRKKHLLPQRLLCQVLRKGDILFHYNVLAHARYLLFWDKFETTVGGTLFCVPLFVRNTSFCVPLIVRNISFFEPVLVRSILFCVPLFVRSTLFCLILEPWNSKMRSSYYEFQILGIC